MKTENNLFKKHITNTQKTHPSLITKHIKHVIALLQNTQKAHNKIFKKCITVFCVLLDRPFMSSLSSISFRDPMRIQTHAFHPSLWEGMTRKAPGFFVLLLHHPLLLFVLCTGCLNSEGGGWTIKVYGKIKRSLYFFLPPPPSLFILFLLLFLSSFFQFAPSLSLPPPRPLSSLSPLLSSFSSTFSSYFSSFCFSSSFFFAVFHFILLLLL